MNYIKKEAKTIAAELKLDDRLEKFSHCSALFTLKDHKVNFENVTKSIVICPAKSEIGIMSKQYLELIGNKIRKKHRLNSETIQNHFWNGLKVTKNKSKSYFIKFDTVDFHLSISKQLLSKIIDYTQYVTNIEEKVIKTIYHA